MGLPGTACQRRRRQRLAVAYLVTMFTTTAVDSFSLFAFRSCSVRTPNTVLSSTKSISQVSLQVDGGIEGDQSEEDSSTSSNHDRRTSKKMKRLNINSNKPFVNQATIRFNNQLNSMARDFEKQGSAEKVEETLRRTLREISMGLELEIQPNVVTFTAVINAWARSRKPDAAERAEAILQWMLELSPVPMVPSSSGLCSDENANTTTNIGPEWDLDSQDEVNLADVLIVKPNCIAFNAAITAWVRSSAKDSHNHAERLMNQLWDLYVASDQDPELRPSARTFNLVINAIARSREPQCGDRAAALLHRMEDLYTAGDEELKPESQTFGAIINAYANDGKNDPQSTDKAAQILQQMNSMYQMGYKGMKPTTFVYNACLNAFAKSEGNAHQATQLLEMMEQQYSKGDLSLKPDVISYSTCINAHANSKSLESGPMAEAVLKRMTERYLVEGDAGVKPNAVTYTATIKAWMTSAAASAAAATTVQEKEDGKQSIPPTVVIQAAERTRDILTTMCLQYLAGDGDQKPTKVTFDLVHDALVNAGDQDGASYIGNLKKRILDHKLPRRESV